MGRLNTPLGVSLAGISRQIPAWDLPEALLTHWVAFDVGQQKLDFSYDKTLLFDRDDVDISEIGCAFGRPQLDRRRRGWFAGYSSNRFAVENRIDLVATTNEC